MEVLQSLRRGSSERFADVHTVATAHYVLCFSVSCLFTYSIIYLINCGSSLHYPEPLQFLPHLLHTIYLFDLFSIILLSTPSFPK